MDRHKIHVFSWIKSLSHSHINLLPIFIKVIFIHIESKWDISKQGFTLRLFVIWFTTIRCCQIFHTGPLKLVMLCVWWDWRRLYSCTVVTWWRSLIAQSLCCILYTHTHTLTNNAHTAAEFHTLRSILSNQICLWNCAENLKPISGDVWCFSVAASTSQVSQTRQKNLGQMPPSYVNCWKSVNHAACLRDLFPVLRWHVGALRRRRRQMFI